MERSDEYHTYSVIKVILEVDTPNMRCGASSILQTEY